jgi:hypothetical protein
MYRRQILAGRAGLGHGLVPVVLEVPHPCAERQRVVLAGLDVPDSKPAACIDETTVPTSCSSPSGTRNGPRSAGAAGRGSAAGRSDRAAGQPDG